MENDLLQDLKKLLENYNATIEFDVDSENLWGPQPRIRVIVPEKKIKGGSRREEKVILELNQWAMDSTDIPYT
jgi:hypothetical protein